MYDYTNKLKKHPLLSNFIPIEQAVLVKVEMRNNLNWFQRCMDTK
jgi:hypothetical protein